MPIAGETMTRRSRRNRSPACRAKVALAAVRGEKTMSELAEQWAARLFTKTIWRRSKTPIIQTMSICWNDAPRRSIRKSSIGKASNTRSTGLPRSGTETAAQMSRGSRSSLDLKGHEATLTAQPIAHPVVLTAWHALNGDAGKRASVFQPHSRRDRR